MTIGKLTRVPLREVWKHEAADFTIWLEQNVDILNEVLDITIANAERERSAGAFHVDLVAEDEHGNTVVIENQLEKSDHDHLGKVITYLAALEAKAAVWIVARPRQEHVSAITWLNQNTSTPFYLVQVEAVRIGESDPAPLFTVIVGPSAEARAAGEVKRELSERHRIRKRFWDQLLTHAKTRTSLHAKVSPSTDNWVAAGAGRTGLSFNYVVRQHGTQVELYFNTGDPGTNLALFEQLRSQQGAIDETFGGPLEWEPLEGKQTCRICARLELGGWRDEEKWAEIAEPTVDAMIRLHGALKAPLRKVKA